MCVKYKNYDINIYNMKTSGLFGFKYENELYMVYNASSSYLSILGYNLLSEVVKMIENNELELWKNLFKKLKIVTQNTEITNTDIQNLKNYSYGNSDLIQDWFLLTKGCQGSFLKVLNSGYLLNSVNTNDLYNYFYLLNFDEETFEIKANDMIYIKFKFNNINDLRNLFINL
jgi:hypothetical protein